MKKLMSIVLIALMVPTLSWAANLKVTTSSSAPVDKIGNSDRPGLLFKFDLPAELLKTPSAAEGQGARIDLAYLRFKVQPDTTEKPLGLLVRPMLAPWVSGLRLFALPDSAALPFHVNAGRVGLKTGDGQVEVTQAVRAWQEGELPNLGFLVYVAARKAAALQLRNLPTGGAAELEIFYTAAEKR